MERLVCSNNRISDFPAITAKDLQMLLPFVETEQPEYLQQIYDAVIDLNQHSSFALIEPNLTKE